MVFPLWKIPILLFFIQTRGGSRGRQISCATEVKIAYLKKIRLQLSIEASRSSY
jgi:hypothetical protein